MSLLRASGVVVRFGGLAALDGVDMRVEEGERVGLIGPNGAGKSTLFDAVGGATPVSEGSVRFAGRDVTGWSVQRRARAGMARTFQRLGLFGELTIRQHVVVADRTCRGRTAFWRDLIGGGALSSDEHERSDDLLARLGLAARAEDPVSTLTLGQARLLEVARALATRPRLLLADEPSSGLAPDETAALAATLRRLQDEDGFAVLLVEHDVALVRSFSTRCVVLDAGRVIADGPTPNVLADPTVRAAYLGAPAAQ